MDSHKFPRLINSGLMALYGHSNLHLIINLSLNVLNFIFLSCATILLFSWSNFPLLVIRLCEISVAQYYRSVTSAKIPGAPTDKSSEQTQENDSAYCSSDEDTLTALEECDGSSAIGCVVGWREDPAIFSDCLKNLKKSDCISGIVVGIAGDSAEDREMMHICREVCLHF